MAGEYRSGLPPKKGKAKTYRRYLNSIAKRLKELKQWKKK